MQYVVALAKNINDANCKIYENSRVTEVKHGNPCILKSVNGTIRAEKVILATHIPVGIYNLHTLLFPYREDAIAVRLKGEYPPEGIYWEQHKASHHSFRSFNTSDGKYLVVIGEPYKTGQQDHTYKGFEQLEKLCKGTV